jgi:dihydroxy-acid dehydratase
VTTGIHRGLTSYGDADFSLFLRKTFLKAMGYSDDAMSRPIVGIADTSSAYNSCHGAVPTLVAAVSRGVLLAGGLPMPFPTISIHESFAHPTSMFLRNLMAMDTEEMIRAQPMDSAVLIGGCDKTVPAQLMGAASVDLPFVSLVAGPMLTGRHRGEHLGACTDCRRYWARYRAEEIPKTEIEQVNGRLAPTVGTCMVMGTASTMACLTEALGVALPGSATIPAVHADRVRCAELSGRLAVEIAHSDSKPSAILTRAAFRNALVVLQALGGSTNALIHLTAIARRRGIKIDFADVDAIGRETPVLVDLKPTGQHYMEHFHWAGGVPRLMRELRDQLDLSARTVAGQTLAEIVDAAEDVPNQTVIRSRQQPLRPTGAMSVLYGNIAPGGAIIKTSAATERLMQHTGRAVVFESTEDLAARIDDPDLDVSADDVLVLRNAGPKGAPGMPEAGYLPIPRKLARRGVTDMVRISDARMSGTAFGTIVVHIVPESHIGGPLALVENGDMIRLDVGARRLDLLVDAEELRRRQANFERRQQSPTAQRGFRKLYLDAVLQADEGCDFDFLGPVQPAHGESSER